MSESARKDAAHDARVPSFPRTKEVERRKAGQLLRAPSERACHATVPCRERETVKRRSRWPSLEGSVGLHDTPVTHELDCALLTTKRRLCAIVDHQMTTRK